MFNLLFLTAVSVTPLLVEGHTAAFAKGMYCKSGPDGKDDNTNVPCWPLYNKKKEDWWFQHDRGCDAAPPKKGDILELPAGKTFTVELAHNQAFTTLSWDGDKATDWPDGQNHPANWDGGSDSEECAVDGPLHTFNESMATGTAWAISYQSEQADVSLDNLVVFSTRKHTPWKRETTYDVPAAMPECPNGVCHCAFLWVASICGQQNIYFQPYKCTVTGSTSTAPLATPKPPKYCNGPGATDACVKGAKQPIIINQASGNNVDALPQPTWGGVYNYGYGDDSFGFGDGALNDIFDSSNAPAAVARVAATSSTPAAVTPASSTRVEVKKNAASPKSHATVAAAAIAEPEESSPAAQTPSAKIQKSANTGSVKKCKHRHNRSSRL